VQEKERGRKRTEDELFERGVDVDAKGDFELILLELKPPDKRSEESHCRERFDEKRGRVSIESLVFGEREGCLVRGGRASPLGLGGNIVFSVRVLASIPRMRRSIIKEGEGKKEALDVCEGCCARGKMV